MRTTRGQLRPGVSAGRSASRLRVLCCSASSPRRRPPFRASRGRSCSPRRLRANREIFVAAADGSGRVDLTRDPHVDVTPSWSADGKRIAFASDRSGAMEIYLMNADGSGVAQVTHDGSFADHPRFTADGRSIVYESKKGGNWEIRRIGADGGGEVDLTRNRASDRYPAVSPNGRLVAFSSNRGTTRHAHLGHEHPGRGAQAGDAAQGQPVRARLGAVGRQAGVRLGHAHGGDEHPDGARQRQGRPSAHRTARRRAGQPVLVSRRALDRLRGLRGRQHDCLHALGHAARRQCRSTSRRCARPSSIRSTAATAGSGSGFAGRHRRPASTEANGKLIDDDSGATSSQGGQYDVIETRLGHRSASLVGDFDVQVDYQLLEWPAANGVQARLSVVRHAEPAFIAIRESQAWGEQYSCLDSAGRSSLQPTS